MRNVIIWIVNISILLIFLAAPAWGQAKPWKGKPKGPPHLEQAKPTEKGTNAEDVAGRVFTEIERRLIERYFGKDVEEKEAEQPSEGKGHGKSKSMPPGLAKRGGNLPPGLARQLQDGALPPGLAKRDLPVELAAQLPKRPDDQERVIVGNDVLLIERATGFVLDVLEDVLLGPRPEVGGPR